MSWMAVMAHDDFDLALAVADTILAYIESHSTACVISVCFTFCSHLSEGVKILQLKEADVRDVNQYGIRNAAK